MQNSKSDDYKVIIVDIRNSDEVLSKHLDDKIMTNFYNIPMNMIRFNKNNILSHLQWVDDIYIMCHSSARSQFIKNKYFINEDRIKVNSNLQFNKFKNPGIYSVAVDDNNIVKVHIAGTFSYNIYNLTRLIQIMLGTIMVLCSTYILYNGKCHKSAKISVKISVKISLYIILIMGLMAFINGVTNTCTISLLLRDYLN